ncbi:MAG: hypothetical protein QM791_06155 [Ferruginibacter sp.]
MNRDQQKDITAFNHMVMRADAKGALISYDAPENLNAEGNRFFDQELMEKREQEFHELVISK